jgi:hypothetical protein
VAPTRAPLAEEWWSWFLPASRRLVAGIVGLAIVLGMPAGVLTLRPAATQPAARPAALPVRWSGSRGWRSPAANWDFFLPRYLDPAIPGFAVLAAVALGRIREGASCCPLRSHADRPAWRLVLDLAGVEPFTG